MTRASTTVKARRPKLGSLALSFTARDGAAGLNWLGCAADLVLVVLSRDAGNQVLGLRTVNHPAELTSNPLRVIERRSFMGCSRLGQV